MSKVLIVGVLLVASIMTQNTTPDPNCNTDNTGTDCSSCKTNFALTTNTNQTSQCYAVGTAAGEVTIVTDCSKYTLESGVNMKNCEVCSASKYPTLRPNSTVGNTCINVTAAVTDCSYYNTDGVNCGACATGKILTSNNTCVAGTTVANCALHNVSNVTLCNQCKSGFVLDQNSACITAPATLITNCQSYNSNGTCYACNSKFVATTDMGACLAQINGCATYATSASNATILTCQTCQANLTLSTNFCFPTIQNCNKYNSTASNSTSSACETCSTTSFKNNNICLVAINDCKEYVPTLSSSGQTLCQTCNSTVLSTDRTKCGVMIILKSVIFAAISLIALVMF